MKTRVNITLDSELLPIFTSIMDEKLIPKSRFFNDAMKNEIEKWKHEKSKRTGYINE